MVIQSLDQVSPDWLTATLKARGILERGAVKSIAFDSESLNRGFVSNIATLRLEYSPDVLGNPPSSLFLKMSKPDVHAELLARGCHEVAFYQAVAGIAHDLPIPMIFDVECDGTTKRSHILMQDLAGTHFQKPLPIPPPIRQCELIVESLARVHARWWNSPRLGVELGERLDETRAKATLERLKASLAPFTDYLGDALLPQQKRAFEQIFASDFLERRTARLMALKNVTLIHGDAHTGNLMLPNDPTRDDVVLVDWHLWEINVATIDLAFLIALHWSPQRRAYLERTLLQRYYDTLIANGVTKYDWNDFWDDYRDAVIIMTLIPIGQYRRNSPAGVVWFGLQDSMAAFEDLECAELLEHQGV